MKTILLEVITPIQCNTSKEPPFTAALAEFGSSVIEIIADYRDVHNATDFNSRYRTMYNGGTSQTPRYMGLFGTRYNEGSIWADSMSGIFNMAEATKIKVNEMLAVENGFELTASYIELDGSVTVKVSAKAPKQIKCKLFVLAVENNHFKQILIDKTVTLSTLKKTLNVSAVPQYPNCKYVVVLQDINNYAPDLVNGSSWGKYEYEIYSVTLAQKK